MRRLGLSPHLRPGDACSWIEWDKTDPRRVAHHAHGFREVFWVLAGEGVHELNGQQYPLHPGSLVFVHEDDFHDLSPLPGGHLRFVNLALDLQTWRYLRRRYWGDRPDPFCAADHAKHVELDELQRGRLAEFSAELHAGYRDRFELERFLLNLVSLTEPRQPAWQPDLPAWLYEGLLQLKDPAVYAGGWQQFVARCGRSREHVARACRKHLGKSPTQLIAETRLRHAAMELAQSDRKVLDIAIESGFSNLGYFYREFSRQYGCTPRGYRLRSRRLIRPT